MALTTETENDTNEETQTRQLRVNKKLSKVISSVPRSRFQKPRPNLPGSKRTEVNVPATRAKTRENPEKIVSEKKEISTPNEKSENNTSEKEEISLVNESSQNKDLKSCTDSNAGSKTLIEDHEDSITLNTESLQNLEEPLKVCSPDKDTNQPVLNSPDKNKYQPLFNLLDKTENQPVINSLDKNKNQTIKNSDKSKNQPIINSPDKSKNQPIINSPDKNKNQPITNSPDKNKNQLITNLVSSAVITNTDRSSKYPHLTSILSKKRAEPRKEVQHKRHKKFKKGDVIPERSKMTMADLIYWNPVNSNPPKKNATPEEEETQTNYDEPEECIDNEVEENEENNAGDSSTGLSVPKLVIAEDGSINIDQSSLVVSRNVPEPTVKAVVCRDETTYSSFRKRPMTKQWTAKDTTVFYKALSLVGTDFGLMEKIFPHRTRRELKLKFKREEKFNIDLINRAMYESQLTFDGTTLEDLIEQLNEFIYEFDPRSKSKENKQKEKTKENKSANAAEKKSTRKRKNATEPVEDEIVDTVMESLLNGATKEGTEVKKQKVGRKRKTKKIDDDFVESDEVNLPLNVAPPAAKDESKVKRKRKSKKLPEDFIDSDEMNLLIEREILEQAISDGEDNLSDETEALPQSDSTLQPSTQANYETTNIEILCMKNITEDDLSARLDGDKAVIVPEDATDITQLITLEEDGTVSQEVSLVGENAGEQCITIEYVDDVNQNNDTTLVNNVMAYEVVSSSTVPISRRRKMNFTPKVPKKEKISDQQPKISSTSYTPV